MIIALNSDTLTYSIFGNILSKTGVGTYTYGSTKPHAVKSVTDRLGSYTDIMDGEGNRVFEANYDAWGKQTVSRNIIGFIRGYTGHEMLPEFGLINMNGRMYDPLLARFLSPDDFVQMPYSPQSYNRYSYCLNNPLKYTDPSGELFGSDRLLCAVFGFVSGYMSNAIFSGDWGWNSIKSGLLNAASSLITYNFLGETATGVTTRSVWTHIGENTLNEVIGKGMPSKTFNLGDHFSVTMSPTFGFGDGGLTGGFGIMASYHNNNFSLGLGFNATNHYMAATVAPSYKDWSLSYTQTFFPAGDFYGSDIGSQRVGTIGISNKNFSFHFSNDYFGDKEDRWRTMAAELCIDDYSFGVLAGTNFGKDESSQSLPAKSKIAGKYEKWDNGKVFVAPAWVGIRNDNQITRLGFSWSGFQDATQNVVHKLMYKTGTGTAKYYLDYTSTYKGLFSYRGYLNSNVLWSK